MKLPRPRLSYANVISTLALVLVVGGGSAFAAGGGGKDKPLTDVTVRSVERWIPSENGELLEAECTPGEVAVGGSAGEGQGTPLGTLRSFTPGGTPTVRDEAGTPVGWQSFGWNPRGGPSGLYVVSAVCASR